ncbi:hypothetical protein [Klebsiella quasipneumoniae]|uniref:hypothetical protein n=1 Tax=Klebsiella quasipneumoniae TaxID=1463165 RepID=UPI0021D088CE|nr:hypothetical protein [Klebsiella quasipneumoniae]MCU6522009.1 hypothetical protein [Klebsiella quasipneumoniae]
MIVYKSHQEDDIWCEFGSAYELIRRSLDEKFPQIAKSNWSFEKAYVNWYGSTYHVSASFTRYDDELKEVVLVSCSAEGSQNNEEISISCGERVPVEFDSFNREYRKKD